MRTNQVYNFALVERYFAAFKNLVQRRKNFLEIKRLDRIAICFDALKDNCHENQRMRYLEILADKFYYKNRVFECFGWMKVYLPKMKRLRELSLVFERANVDKINRRTFDKLIEVYQERTEERYNREISGEFYRQVSLRKSFIGWFNFVIKQKRADRNYRLIRAKKDDNMVMTIFKNWANFVPEVKKARENEELLQDFRIRSLLRKSWFGIREYYITKHNQRVLIQSHRQKFDFAKKSKIIKFLKIYTLESKRRKEVDNICRKIYGRNMCAKALIGLYEYKELKKEKRELDKAKTREIEKIVKTSKLKSWVALLYRKSRKRMLFVKINRVTKAVFLRRLKQFKKDDKSKIFYMRDRRPYIMLENFFRGWKEQVEYKKQVRKNFEIIREKNLENVKRRNLKIWVDEYRRYKGHYMTFVKAVMFTRREYLVS
jgi:hypothetical protein